MNVHGLPVVHVQWCEDSQAGDRVSLINMDEIRTIRATQDKLIWGELYPGSALFFLRDYMRRFQAKTEAVPEELQAEIDASPDEAAPAVERQSGQLELEHGPPLVRSLKFIFVVKLANHLRSSLNMLAAVHPVLATAPVTRQPWYHRTRAW